MKPGLRFEIYRDASGEWRWRAVAGNGQIVADSSEGYKRKWNAKRAAKRFVTYVVIP